MTWPDVLRWLVLIMGCAASLAGLAWVLGRVFFRPWFRNEIREGTALLYRRLTDRSVRHREDRLPHRRDSN